MGPRSENRGYALPAAFAEHETAQLQWVHGPRTVVMVAIKTPNERWYTASMGPRSENRGYGSTDLVQAVVMFGFNGSTVREPWL